MRTVWTGTKGGSNDGAKMTNDFITDRDGNSDRCDGRFLGQWRKVMRPLGAAFSSGRLHQLLEGCLCGRMPDRAPH